MDWRHSALCQDEDPELFFPIGAIGPSLRQVKAAKSICRRCGVTDDCLSWATGHRAGLGSLGRQVGGGTPAYPARKPRPTAHRQLDSTASTRRKRSPASAVSRPSVDLVEWPPPPRCRRGRRAGWRASHAFPPRRACERSAGRALGCSGRSPAGSPRPSSATTRSSWLHPARARRAGSLRPASRARRRSCTSSESTSASGGRERAGHHAERTLASAPNRPRTPRRRRPTSWRRAVDHGVEVDLLVERLRQGLVHQRDRRHPADRLREGLPGLRHGHPPGLQAQQRRDGLQVVLHPVVDLADGRVLGEQLALTSAQLAWRRGRARACRAGRRASAGSPQQHHRAAALHLVVRGAPPHGFAKPQAPGGIRRRHVGTGAAARNPGLAVHLGRGLPPARLPLWPRRR